MHSNSLETRSGLDTVEYALAARSEIFYFFREFLITRSQDRGDRTSFPSVSSDGPTVFTDGKTFSQHPIFYCRYLKGKGSKVS